MAISVYQRFGTSDMSLIRRFGVSIQFRPTLTLLSDIEKGCAFINADIASGLISIIYNGVGRFKHSLKATTTYFV